MVLTLLSATYDAAAATLTYEVTLLDAELITDVAFEQEPLTVLDAPREYAEASLFIDDVVVPLGQIPVDRPEGPICIEGAGVDCSDPNWWIHTPEPTGLEVWSITRAPDESCPIYSPSFTCNVVKCQGNGPGPCSGQGTNCCDHVCAGQGQTSQYATFVGCVDTDGTNGRSTANWSCECA